MLYCTLGNKKFDSVGLALLLLACLNIFGCESNQNDEPVPLRPVRYITVTDSDAARTRTFSGASQSTQVSRLSFKVSGTLIELPIEIGDTLAAGDLLARLDQSSFDLEVQQAQANLVQAQANERNAAANYERVKDLYSNRNASRNDLDSARANSESAGAQVRAAQKSLELSQLNRSYARLTAERDCSVASVDVELNENISAGAQVALVNCGDGLEIELAIPESLIASITKDTNVSISFSAIPNTTFSGKVTEIGISSASGAPTFPVTVAIDEKDERLRSGLAADVTFQFMNTGRSDTHLLPLSAVANNGGNAFVYIAQPDGANDEAIVVKREVSVGELTELGVEILSGIRQGDRVITAGVSVIRDGQRVLLN